LQVIHRAASSIHMWSYLLPPEQRGPMDIGCNRLMPVIAVLLACSWRQETCWKSQEKVMMSTAASFPSVVKPRFIEPVGERTKLPKVDAR
jgi:hypothetical protein